MEKLASDKKPSVRAAVPYNPNVTDKIMKELSEDEVYFVRKAVADNL